ncbi:aminotransferase DegT [Archaeoglobales archaeon]|nr:MAG: aminotransferase DegT [Archaeoglobales archaeon]
MNIPIAKPTVEDGEIKGIIEVLKSGMLAQGKVVEEFERSFAKYVGVDHAIAVCNGTVALDLALKALKIKEGDEVITTSFTFIATSNSILYQGAKPIFIDIDGKTYNINPDEIVDRITPKTKAIMGVHLYGHPFDVKPLMDICEDHKLVLIEDAAQAHGAECESKKVGGFGIGCFSFYPTKNMTTGEGGMITTDDANFAEKIRLLRNHGDTGKYNHTMLGYNYRMTNIQAAIGMEQLKKLDELNKKRRENAKYLSSNIKVDGLVKPFEKRSVKHVYHQYVIRVEEEFPMYRDEFMQYLTDEGVGCAIHYPKPIYKQQLYVELKCQASCPVAEEVSKKVLSIPVHPGLTKDELKFIVKTVNDVVS